MLIALLTSLATLVIATLQVVTLVNRFGQHTSRVYLIEFLFQLCLSSVARWNLGTDAQELRGPY